MRRRRPQSGQAIVLILLIFTVLIAMAALAIDGSRGYALRRDLQAAVDSAALAAADKLQQTGSYAAAEQAATTNFSLNLRIYASPSCSPGYGSPGSAAYTVTCTFPDGTTLTDVATRLGPQGSQFKISATHRLLLLFAGILMDGANPTLTVSGTSGINNLLYAPAVAALDQAGCGGKPGSAISISGGGTLDIRGDLVSAGAIAVTSGRLRVGGDIYARCQSSIGGSVTVDCYPSDAPTPCTFPDMAGATRSGYHLADPNYGPPPVTGPGQGAPGVNVVLSPGVYTMDPVFNNNLCWFLSGGVYEWQGGLTNDGDFLSNELKPPAEPSAGNNTVLAGRQFWNTNSVNCAGSYQLSAIGGPAIQTGTWAIEVTSTRTDIYRGVNYFRESSPSICRTVAVGPDQVIQVRISNVPGATAYNVYAAPPPNGCAGPFGLVGPVQVTGPVQNSNTARCPDYTGLCSLGTESGVFDSTLLGGATAPNPLAAPDTPGAYPPDSETPPLGFRQVNQNPDRAKPPHGDRANENQCETVVGALSTCPAAVTPGAVVFYLPSGGCLTDTNNGDNFVFSGYQYNWITLYEPGTGHPPANTCANLDDAASNSAYIGLVYMPAASIDFPTRVAFRTEGIGGIMADTIRFSGSLPLIVGSSDYAPAPPASRLVY